MGFARYVFRWDSNCVLKIRAMQLIKQFEKDARGPYAGVYGSIDINGALTLQLQSELDS